MKSGMPPLDLMEGFYKQGSLRPYDQGKQYQVELVEEALPIKWECLKRDPIHALLNHSDCDGYIPWRKCAKIADRLEQILPLLPDEDGGGHIGNWRAKTKEFIDGLRLASANKERVEFY